METLDGRLQLNPDVTVRPVADYPLTVQERLSGAVDDYIVSERRSRFSAIRVSASAAELLRLFDAPKLIGEAMVELADRIGAPPQELLTEAFPVLVEMRQARVLIGEDEARSNPRARAGGRRAPGHIVEGYTVVRALDVTTETEIYELRGADGARAALKLVPADAPDFVRRAAERECLVLPVLAARQVAGTPRLIADVRGPEAHHVILSWHEGRTLNHAARDPALGLLARLRIARSLTEIYANLHAAGVRHGDVHGGNVLVDGDGTPCVIDYGAASVEGVVLPELMRIGLVEAYEPEAAAELLAGRDLPDMTDAGEQFALASLLTLTVAGRPALMLPLEHRAALEAIVSRSPRAWDMPGADGLSRLEAIVGRGLATSPDDRFATLAAFATAVLEEIDRSLPQLADQAPARATQVRGPQAAIREGWGLASGILERGLPHAPTASIYYGAAGVALGLLRASVLAGDGELLAAAQVWLRRAFAEGEAAEAFDGPALGVARARIGRLSVLNNDVGLPYVAALAAQAVGDKAALDRALRAAAERLGPAGGDDPDFALDLAAGLPGRLVTSVQLAELADPGSPEHGALIAAASALREILLDVVSAGASDGAYLGFAHGMAGALYALIVAEGRLSAPADPRLLAALNDLAGQAVSDGEGVAWPIRREARPTLGWSGWCHGGAGHVQLWLAAAEVMDPRRCEALAEGAAEFAWRQRHDSGCSICCGGAGLALSYAKLAGTFGDMRWRRRAEALVFGERQDTRDLCAPASLFRGQLGVELVRLELAAGGAGAFPVLDSPLAGLGARTQEAPAAAGASGSSR